MNFVRSARKLSVLGIALAACCNLAPAPVSASSTGSITLKWTWPTKNTNGTALTNLSGVQLYYGSSASSMNSYASYPVSHAPSLTVGGLPMGKVYYIGAVAYTSNGERSAMTVTQATVK
jgi:hypothetical protein